ncbi:MAG TPA: hypothetical protein DDW81_10770 [Cryomorphaceae bacterium]|nr:hypothetical protein [Cryomorphaceae bacterium]
MNRIYSLLIFLLALGFGAKAQNSVHVQVYVVDMNNQPVPFWHVYFNAYGDQNFNINNILGTNGTGVIDTMFSYPSGLNDLLIFVSTRGCDGSWAGVGDTLFNPSGTYTYQDTLVINCPDTANCSLNFTHSSSSSQPATVSFSPSGQGPSGAVGSGWSVDFGDGTSQVVYTAPFTHTYSQPGQYQVCMSTTYSDTILGITYCTVTHCDSVVISSLTPTYNCNASINASPSPNSSNPYRAWIQYQTSYSSIPLGGTLTRTIDFGDGSTINASAGAGFYHSYASPGVYFPSVSVVLKDSLNNIVCSSYDMDSIYFAPPAAVSCSAQLNVTQNTNTYLSVNATATGSTVQNLPSGGYVRMYYDFGNGYGGPSTPTANRFYQYSQPGLYYVCLKQVAFDANNDTLCISYDCDSINVIVPYNCNASFTVDTANSGNGTVYLWNNSSWDSSAANVYQWWDFGDGDTLGGAFPTHTYSGPGTYVVCLFLYTYGPAGVCQSSFCDTLTVDSAGNVVFKNGSFILVVRDPATIGVDESKVETMSIYPNPADDFIMVEGAASGELKWQLIDMKGVPVSQSTEYMNGGDLRIDVSGFAKGLYILRLENGSSVEHHKVKLER